MQKTETRKSPFRNLTSAFFLLTSAFSFVRDRGLISRASTSAEIRNLLGRLENRLRRVSCCRSSFSDHLFELLPCPSDAGNFDDAICGNPKRGRDIGQPVSIRHREGFRVVHQNRKSHSVSLHELGRIALLVLRNT